MKAGRRRVVFVKAITPAPAPASESAPEFDPSMDLNRPMSGHMFDLVCKALHDGEITVGDAARANDAYLGGRPLPHDLIEFVVARAASCRLVPDGSR